MMMRKMLLALALCSMAGAAQAGKGCDDLKAKIDAKIQAKGVRGYSLDIVGVADVGSAKVVGQCDGGTKRIVYARGAGGRANVVAPEAKAAAAPSAPATTAAPKPAPKPAKPKAPPALGNY